MATISDFFRLLMARQRQNENTQQLHQ